MTPNDIERFHRFYDRLEENECWIWKGATDPNGYGRFGLGGRPYSAHRIAFEIHHGRTPKTGMVITHLCGQKNCVNPHHLAEMTHTEAIRLHNSGDMHPNATVPEHLKKWAVQYAKDNGLKSGATMRMIENEGYKVHQSTVANWLAGRFRSL